MPRPHRLSSCDMNREITADDRVPNASASWSVHKAGSLCGVVHSSLSRPAGRSEEHTSELQSLMRISYAVFCLKKKIYSLIYTISVSRIHLNTSPNLLLFSTLFFTSYLHSLITL